MFNLSNGWVQIREVFFYFALSKEFSKFGDQIHLSIIILNFFRNVWKLEVIEAKFSHAGGIKKNTRWSMKQNFKKSNCSKKQESEYKFSVILTQCVI